MKSIFVFLVFTMTVASAAARELEGVSLPETREVAGRALSLNGAGLRTATILNVKVWVGAFYAPAPLRTPEAVFASSGPLRFDFVFVRDVSRERGAEAWRWQFGQSNQHAYPDLKKDVETLAGAFGPIKKGTVQTVSLTPGETLVYENDVLKARIPGRDFQEAFLSVFVGPKPPSESLKKAFLSPP